MKESWGEKKAKKRKPLDFHWWMNSGLLLDPQRGWSHIIDGGGRSKGYMSFAWLPHEPVGKDALPILPQYLSIQNKSTYFCLYCKNSWTMLQPAKLGGPRTQAIIMHLQSGCLRPSDNAAEEELRVGSGDSQAPWSDIHIFILYSLYAFFWNERMHCIMFL